MKKRFIVRAAAGIGTKRLLVALAITLGASSAFAVEAEQWNPPAGSKTRAEVIAELRAAQASGQMNNRNEAYDGTNYQSQSSAASTVSRQQVQAEGTYANHHHAFNPDYVD